MRGIRRQYDQLTVEERVNLFLAAACRNDDAEANALMTTRPDGDGAKVRSRLRLVELMVVQFACVWVEGSRDYAAGLAAEGIYKRLVCTPEDVAAWFWMIKKDPDAYPSRVRAVARLRAMWRGWVEFCGRAGIMPREPIQVWAPWILTDLDAMEAEPETEDGDTQAPNGEAREGADGDNDQLAGFIWDEWVQAKEAAA